MGASDPQVLSGLPALGPLEKIGIGGNHTRRPRAVVRFQVIQRVCSDSQNLSKSPRPRIFQRFQQLKQDCLGSRRSKWGASSATRGPKWQLWYEGAPARFSTERIEHK